VIDAVGEFDLGLFYASYRHDGWGRAAHDPAMMVALLLYAYAIGERSSRRIERHCEDDVAFRVIAANQIPDHATIARSTVRHERCAGRLFGQVLELCAEAGLVAVGVVAVDATKLYANASQHATRDYAQIAAETRGWVQGYNAQAVATEQQIVIAAEVTVDSPDFGHLEPMIAAAETELAAAGVTPSPAIVLADAGYWHHIQTERLTSRGMIALVPEWRLITATHNLLKLHTHQLAAT
jgi:transposase